MGKATFATRKAAAAELARMRGWSAKIVQLYLPGDQNANKSGNVFAIACGQGNSDALYLQDDGYVN